MTGLIIKGVLVGLTFAVMFGPAFFSLIQTSISRGFRSGVYLATGIFISDIAVVFLCYLGAEQILGSDPRDNIVFSFIGGIVLIIFGVYTFMHKSKIAGDPGKTPEIKAAKWYIYVIKGFLLNTANPSLWFLWITVIVSFGSDFTFDKSFLYFLSGIVFTTFITDILKCIISNQIKHLLSRKIMMWLNKIVGVAIGAFGIYLMLNITGINGWF